MRAFAMKAMIGVLAAGAAMPAFAADLYEPAPEPAPVYTPAPAPAPVETGGWYIRGDIGYRWSDMRGSEYVTNGYEPILDDDDNIIGYEDRSGINGFDTHKLKGALSAGAGVGYQITDHFRVDATVDHWFKSDFKGSTYGDFEGEETSSIDTSSMSAWLLLANAYVDLGNFGGFTPYVGAGIGGAHVKWDKLRNDPNIPGIPPVEHEGASSWRFAAAAMAGASYCLTSKLKLDAGYRFTHVAGGDMFGKNGSFGGPGWDKGFNNHEVRTGLRYALGGGSSGCSEPEPVAYEPGPAPVAEAVYK